MSETLKSLLSWGTKTLQEQGITEYGVDAWLILSHIFKIRRMDYLIDPEQAADAVLAKSYQACIHRRSSGYPVQYITGEQEFMGLSFQVTPAVLIPRQDTEILVEAAAKYVTADSSILDMCTGSGCILISLLALKHCAYGEGADLSPEALKIAKENARRLVPKENVSFTYSDLFENIDKTFDVIVSNPPYIPSAQIDTLMQEVRCHEPHMALDGHGDGLYFYARIVREAPRYLKEGGMLFFEIGWDQAAAVGALMKNAGFCQIQVKKDLAGLDRVVYGVLL